jgi:hypothetical protein
MWASNVLLRSRVSTTISSKSPLIVFALVPLRELPLLCPAGSCILYPSDASTQHSTHAPAALSSAALKDRFHQSDLPASDTLQQLVQEFGLDRFHLFSLVLRRTFTQFFVHPRRQFPGYGSLSERSGNPFHRTRPQDRPAHSRLPVTRELPASHSCWASYATVLTGLQ